MPTPEGSEDNKGWLETLAEGGLPQVLGGPAGKAISRLIGAGVEIPAAWLEQKAQAIRDETKARSLLMDGLSQKSAELGLTDATLLQRGLDNLLGRAYREQANKEAIGAKTFVLLEDEPAPESSQGPSDDWMNVFEGYAAHASSENIRQLFAKVLAGEIRRPGQFSLSAMHVVSILDERLAKKVERVAPFVWNKQAILRDGVPPDVTYRDFIDLEDIGFLSTGSGLMTNNLVCNSNGYLGLTAGTTGVLGLFSPDQKISIPMYAVSLSGQELLSVLEIEPDIACAALALTKAGATKIEVGNARESGTNMQQIFNLVEYDLSADTTR